MSERLIDLIYKSLQPSGPKGFEGLIAELLSQLTGQRFRLSKSGQQGGRDVTSDFTNSTVVAVECKRYGKDTELEETHLLGKLAQAVLDLPDLDLWVIAASRPVSDQLARNLQSAAMTHGVEFRTIESSDDKPSAIAALLARHPDGVLRHLADIEAEGIEDVKRELAATASLPGFSAAVARLQSDFMAGWIGYDAWRNAQRDFVLETLRDEAKSRARLGQPVPILGSGLQVIARRGIANRLTEWWANWSYSHQLLAILGEEGDGKTWAVADWLAQNLSRNSDFVPTIFANARNVASTEPLTLLAQLMAQQLTGEEGRWRVRIDRWVKQQPVGPTVLLVLDGVNERHGPHWWRLLFEALAPLRASVAVVTTCRTEYWQRHFRPLRYLDVAEAIVTPFSDDELSEALSGRDFRRNDFRNDVLPLLRKPRYFDLACRLRSALETTGDVTRERLLYEDWRDRYERKAGIVDPTSFDNLLMGLASTALEGERLHTADALSSFIPHEVDREGALRELSTGGVVVERFGKYVVHEERLKLGLGLLLANDVREAADLGHEEIRERISDWLEPQAGMDIKGEALASATIHALSVTDFPLSAAVALLFAWAIAQNAPGTEEFKALFPLRPEAYFELAERAWADEAWHADLHELLRRTLIQFRDSSRFEEIAIHRFERWLGFVHQDGPAAMYRNDSRMAERAHSNIASRLGRRLEPGKLDLAGFRLTVVERPGLLRLGRLALSVISCGPRAPFVRAIATACLAEAAMVWAEKYELLTWVVRLSPDKIDHQILSHARILAESKSTVGNVAARSLLSHLGTAVAFQHRSRLPAQELLERPNPCNFLPWSRQHAGRCLEQQGTMETQAVARALSKACVDPGFTIPAATRKRLEELPRALWKDSLWTSRMGTIDDHLVDGCEPTLCAAVPDSYAEFFRTAAGQLEVREGTALQILFWRLHHHSLVWTTNIWQSLERLWRKLCTQMNGRGSHDGASVASIVDLEANVFGLLLLAVEADKQLRLLLERPVCAKERLTFERYFRWPPNWHDVVQALQAQSSESATLRVLWFISRRPSEIPEDVLAGISTYLRHGDSFVRQLALEILGHAGSDVMIEDFLASDWSAGGTEHPWEESAGSWIWATRAHDRSFRELRSHVSKEWLARAVEHRGFQPDEVAEYAQFLDSSLGVGATLKTLPPYDVIDSKVDDAPRPPLLDVEVDLETPTYTPRGHTWGDSTLSDAAIIGRALDFEDRIRRADESRRAVLDAADDQRRAGNLWFVTGPPQSTLEAVITSQPEIVTRWLAASVSESTDARLVYLHPAFFEELCMALLKVWPDRGVDLWHQLGTIQGLGLRRDEATQARLIDLALWRVESHGPVVEARRHLIREAKSDLELARLAIAAEVGGRTEWLCAELRKMLQSGRLLEAAQAIALAGLMSDSRVWEDVTVEFVRDKPRHWVDEFATTVRAWRERDGFARHWFTQFTVHTDDVEAWASFRLFLRCVDRRFWIWRSAIEDAAPGETYTDSRRRFLEYEISSVKEATQKNEQALKKTLLAGRVLQSQISPWLDCSTS